MLISKPHWMWGAEIGANEHGLVIGNEAIFASIEASLQPGIIGMDYLRLALERAIDVDEGIAVITTLLREHGQSGNCGFKRPLAYDNSFILACPKGAAVLETVDRDWAVKRISDQYAISNALTIDDFKSGHEDPSRSVSGCYRRARAMELLEERSGRLRVKDFFDILRDHKEGEPTAERPSGPRICAHTRESPLGQTTSSWVASLAPGKLVHWVTGTAAPCGGVFKPVVLEHGLPPHGSRPGAERDDTSLWWRHERLQRTLDEQPRDTHDAFTAERDGLERGFLDAVTACPPVSEDREYIRRVVERCWRDALGFEDRWLARLTS